MTGVIFKQWLEKLNNSMKVQGRKILLFVNNCAAHPGLTMWNVKMVCLPPNTTSRMQPCDAGIIVTRKAHYRKRLTRHVLTEIDDAQTATGFRKRVDDAQTAIELRKRVDMLEAIRWVQLAWARVSDTTITKSVCQMRSWRGDSRCLGGAAGAVGRTRLRRGARCSVLG